VLLLGPDLTAAQRDELVATRRIMRGQRALIILL